MSNIFINKMTPDKSTNEVINQMLVINQMQEIILEEETKLIKELSNRNINDVIKKMLKLIPEEETKLIEELSEYSKNTWNIAPELLSNGDFFGEVAYILNNNILNIDCKWKKDIQKLFANE